MKLVVNLTDKVTVNTCVIKHPLSCNERLLNRKTIESGFDLMESVLIFN